MRQTNKAQGTPPLTPQATPTLVRQPRNSQRQGEQSLLNGRNQGTRARPLDTIRRLAASPDMDPNTNHTTPSTTPQRMKYYEFETKLRSV